MNFWEGFRRNAEGVGDHTRAIPDCLRCDDDDDNRSGVKTFHASFHLDIMITQDVISNKF